MSAKRIRAYSADGQVLHEGKAAANGPTEFTSDQEVAYVVFYDGPLAEETVLGKVTLGANRTGDISVELA